MPCLPSLGTKAPNFSANTTFGPIKLSDYKGKWVVLFSHPGDFTPVCTTEFLCFAKYYSNFQKRNTELIGLSVDSNSSHLAWVYNIYRNTGVEIPFPIIDDRKMEISQLYGMISEPMSDSSTVRSVFIIDPNQILRTILYYPLTTGRNIPEIVRIIDALQTSDEQKVVTPADWLPGMPVILPPPKTYKELKQRISSCEKDKECIDWYLCFVPDKNLGIKSNKSINKKKLTAKSRPQINSPEDYVPQNPNCPDINRLVGTYVLGDPSSVDAFLLDFVIYAFAEIKSDGTLFIPTPRYLRQLLALRQDNPDLRVIVAIGGWGQDGFSDAALTPSSRYNFAREVNALIKEYNLDGIDIDWEYPATSAAGIKSRPEDRENFTLLLTAIRDVIGYDKWLSVAGTGDKAYINQSVEIDNIAPLIDYFNLMSYDFTAGETGPNAKKHHSNLYDSNLSIPGYSADAMVRNLIAAGMPSQKILLGIPFYGRLGATITKSYDQLRKDFINKNGYTYKFDRDAQAPYLEREGEFAMSYDDILSIYIKGQYVIDNCLGGMFSWMAPYDRANILARAMNEGINDPNKLRQEIEDTYGPGFLK
ncbi:bifunctional protein: peroxiredoxin/chitinase [[Clostridium] sordellii]|uniref:Peroxiredoxin n=1 Tax=Paraclostridium sordellii TaxID=1505 RepID=A0ABM9RN09_PARSO|nr:peroxiredoxin [Paeniclostridium sordellii]CEJ73325.1 putative bifunctional protein: peroxiredoxin/chitinase [[Clostridium] sordellii] [Paeniclostridium sordellii]CEN68878.1 bifunctional protein: peroxiredoxin/chitinase [[Clostridium] sordellii] [Paeniclostridium sordellii]CEN72145.1 bifunctional protein: peroxiredoxin/chitinase [[Clostridium] sordellii] [Paeniclostridium sordellii]CEO23231.1 bifunctional protein: peroxiredoxin/chitinase [[Clostridium] sordellii] [Paeniclostridium sordellii]